MRLLFGREGFGSGAVADHIRALEPDWEVVGATGDEFSRVLKTADVVVPITEPVTGAMLDGTSVRFIQQFGVGTDAIDLEGARRLGIPVANIPSHENGNADAVAEIAVLLTISLVRQVDRVREDARSGSFARGTTPALFSRRILVVGLGGLGSAVAARLAPFGCTIVGIRSNPHKGGVHGVSEVHAPGELRAQLAHADVVILCTPAGDGHLLDRAALGALKPGGYVVNVGRGSLIDEQALIDALDSGAVGGAGLDVLVHEPPRADEPLVSHPRVIVLPHVGGIATDVQEAGADRLVENIRRFATADGPRWVRN